MKENLRICTRRVDNQRNGESQFVEVEATTDKERRDYGHSSRQMSNLKPPRSTEYPVS